MLGDGRHLPEPALVRPFVDTVLHAEKGGHSNSTQFLPLSELGAKMFMRYSLSDGQEHLVAKSIERKIYCLQDQPTVFDAVRSLGINAIKRWIEWSLCLTSAYFLSGKRQAAQ